jgi:hypothetical protein
LKNKASQKTKLALHSSAKSPDFAAVTPSLRLTQSKKPEVFVDFQSGLQSGTSQIICLTAGLKLKKES